MIRSLLHIPTHPTRGDLAVAFYSGGEELISVHALVAIAAKDWGGDSQELRGFVVRGGDLVEAEDCDDFLGYIWGAELRSGVRSKSYDAIMERANRIRAQRAKEVS